MADIEQTPKKRGRPPTGQALTNAERQSVYRRKQSEGIERDYQKNLNIWINSNSYHALNALAKANGLSRQKMLEKLIDSAFESLAQHTKERLGMSQKNHL